MSKWAELPGCCVKCGRTDELIDWPRKFMFVPNWVYLFLLLRGFGLLVAYLIFRKTARLILPICPECQRQWQRDALFWRLAIFYTIMALLGAVLLMTSLNRLLQALAGVLAISVIAVPIYFSRRMRRSVVQCAKITKTTITLSGLHSRMEEMILSPRATAALGQWR